MVPLLRSRRSHHRRAGTGHRPQPQTNPHGRKYPNRKTRPSGQAQESPADPPQHPRSTGTARLGTLAAPAAPTVTPTVGFSAPGQPKPALPSLPTHPEPLNARRQAQEMRENRQQLEKNGLTGPLIWDKWTRDWVACGPPPLTCGSAGAPHRTPHSNREDSTFAGAPMVPLGEMWRTHFESWWVLP